MKALIHGAGGYIGSALHSFLVQCGHRVAATGSRRLLEGHAFDSQDTDVVYFLAWPRAQINNAWSLSQRRLSLSKMENTFRNYAEFKMGRRLVFLSSCQAIEPLNPYGEDKRAFEEFIRARWPNTVILRPATVYGISPHMRWDTCINAMVKDAVLHSRVRIMGPEIVRSHLNILDLLKVLMRSGINGVSPLHDDSLTLSTRCETLKATGRCIANFFTVQLRRPVRVEIMETVVPTYPIESRPYDALDPPHRYFGKLANLLLT